MKSLAEDLPSTPYKRNQQQKARISDNEPHHGSWWVMVFWHQFGTKERGG